jgi:hypothetical protein
MLRGCCGEQRLAYSWESISSFRAEEQRVDRYVAPGQMYESVLGNKSFERRTLVLGAAGRKEEHRNRVGIREEGARELGEDTHAVAAAPVGCHRTAVAEARERDQRPVDYLAAGPSIERRHEAHAAGVGIVARVD